MVRGVPLLLLLPLLLSAQDKPAEDPFFCRKFNKCHKKHERTRKQCECGKKKIYTEDALCNTCSRKGKLCRHCGREKYSSRAAKLSPHQRIGMSTRADNIREYLTYLASDDLEGRAAGFEGGDKAAEYIRDKIKGWGLKPGNRDDYFQSFDIDKGKRKTKNIVGLWEGTSLKDEYVVIGGHYDHVGKSGQKVPGKGAKKGKKDDKIWNGADDNASGSSTLMEIARAICKSRIRFKRTVVFIWFGAEEWGLLGSKHYCKEPLFPLNKTYAMICMDMVGRNSDKPVDIKGLASAKPWRDIVEKAAEGTKLDYRAVKAATGATDYLTFIGKDIPSIDFHSNKHADYHEKSDHADKIDYDQCREVARVAIGILGAVSDRTDKLEFTKPPRR